MIKAYHYIPGPNLVDWFLEEGAIPTPLHLLDPSWMSHRCREEIERFRFAVEDEKGAVPEVGIKALQSLFDQAVRQLEREQKSAGAYACEELNFTCTDLIAKDYRNVFLSPLTWYWRYDLEQQKPSGLVFDALELVRQGARVRSHDLMDTWDDAIAHILVRKWGSLSEAKGAISEAISRTINESEMSGSAAEEFLIKSERQEPARQRAIKEKIQRLRRQHEKKTGKRLPLSAFFIPTGSYIEIVYEGPLSFEGLVEVWRDGKITSR